MFGALGQTLGANTAQGTANPPFSVVTEQDPGIANVTLHYHSISCMPQYIKWSPEELRVQDSAVGRKNASSNVQGVPQVGGFGATTPATSGFGNNASINPFRQPAANTTANPFGQSTANMTANPFGANT